MEHITKTIGNAEFTFYVNSRGNRSGFVHECELWMGNEMIAQENRQYYNRTWESYQYQTVMCSCVSDAIEQAMANIREHEKTARGWKILTQARKNEVQAIIDENSGIKVLRALYDDVYNAAYGTESERRDLETLNVLNAMLEVLFGRTEEPASAA